MARALNLKSEGGNALVKTLSGKRLGSAIGPALREKLENPIVFNRQAGDPAHGYDATVLIYGKTPAGPGRYSPPECVGTRKKVITGNPDEAHISTSYVERANLSIRMGNRRFTRLTNAFSKKIDNHVHALALFFCHYNFCRIHKTLKVTPGMAAGVTDTLWSLEDIAERIEANRPAPGKRGPYRKRTSR